MQEFTFENNEGSCDKVVQMWQHSDMWGHPNTKRKKNSCRWTSLIAKWGHRDICCTNMTWIFFFNNFNNNHINKARNNITQMKTQKTIN